VLLADFDYRLPPELIAQEPLADRAASRMLVLDRASGTWRDCAFRDFPLYVGPGDCVILNDTRVLPSRLYGRRTFGDKFRKGEVEIFLTRPLPGDGLTWEALVRPGKKMRTGETIVVFEHDPRQPELEVEILGRGEFGERTVRLRPRGELFEVLDRIGHVPLPPYIHRPDTSSDRERYQTVFARERGSVAAPTAGLHFTPEVLESVRASGAEIAQVTLHVGLGTFQPVHSEKLEDVHLHAESFTVPPETVEAMDRAKRVIAVGTTAVRAIESDPSRTETELFIAPGFKFCRTQAMLTNFHLPRSTLLILVCAFAGRELVLAAYRHAVDEQYRFFSYGDCMLVL
jgi:S-adenosylmethionine:tRNA ribosyltransferase-isomerase